MRWIQVTPDVILKSYILFKPLDLSRSNGQKKTFININILIDLKCNLNSSHIYIYIYI